MDDDQAVDMIKETTFFLSFRSEIFFCGTIHTLDKMEDFSILFLQSRMSNYFLFFWGIAICLLITAWFLLAFVSILNAYDW